MVDAWREQLDTCTCTWMTTRLALELKWPLDAGARGGRNHVGLNPRSSTRGTTSASTALLFAGGHPRIVAYAIQRTSPSCRNSRSRPLDGGGPYPQFRAIPKQRLYQLFNVLIV